MTALQNLPDVLRPIRLCRGQGQQNKQGCWMTALSQWVGDAWTDSLDCVDYPINRLCIYINDALSDARRSEVTLPILLIPLGTAGDHKATMCRSRHLLDVAIRRWLAEALEGAGCKVQADSLRNLPMMNQNTTAKQWKIIARAALDALDALDAIDALAAPAARAAVRDQFIINEVIPVLRELIAMGPHATEEPCLVLPVAKFHKAIGVTA